MIAHIKQYKERWNDMNNIENLSRINQRKKTRAKRFLSTYTFIITLFVIAGIAMTVSLVYLYTSTKSWHNSNADTNFATLAPEYVSNYPNATQKEAQALSKEVGELLTKIETDNALPDSEETLSKVKKYIEDNSIESGHLYDEWNRLKTYTTSYKILNDYKNKLDIDTFKENYTEISKMIITSNREHDKQLMTKLGEIVDYYTGLSDIITKVLPTYGEVHGTTYLVNPDISDVTDLTNALKPYNETQIVKDFIAQLTNANVTINENYYNYTAKANYDKFKDLVSNVTGLYVQASTLKTVKDATNNGWKIPGNHKQDDKILTIWYNGREVSSTDWIKLNAPIRFDVETKVELPQTSETTQTTQTTENVRLPQQSTEPQTNTVEIPSSTQPTQSTRTQLP